jgi:multiple sugar transport system substrate-binding protein
MLKQILAVTLFLLLFILLASCSAPSATPVPAESGASASPGGASSGSGTTLTTAATYESQQLGLAVTEFEKADPGVKVQVQNFNQQLQGMKGSGQTTDTATIIQQLNAEMMSGVGPDIINVDGLPYEKYADKGLLSDIGTLMAGDNSFDRSQFLGNILNACEYNGKLYAVPTGFSFNVLACKAEYSPGTGNVTLDQFLQKAQALPLGVFAFAKHDPMQLFLIYMQDNCASFVNNATHTCSFDSPAFIDTIKAFKTLCDTKMSDKDAHNGQENEQLLKGTVTYSVLQFAREKDVVIAKTALGDTAVFTNLPMAGDTSIYPFQGRDMLAINSNGKNKDLAWKFIKTMLSVGVQSSNSLDGFPVMKSACDAKIDYMATEQLILDNNGGKKAVMQFGDTSVEVKPLNASDSAWLKDHIGKLNKLSTYGDSIITILQDELPPFFAGEKSAGDVANLIQNRVNLVLNE